MRLFKNVDIINLEKILNEGILSLEESGNDNWEDGYRVDNARDVVYLFRQTGEENSFCQYGTALLEVEVDGAEKQEMSERDCNKEKYEEYIIRKVLPEQVKAAYIPEIFREKAQLPEELKEKVTWCGMRADYYADESSREKEKCSPEMLSRFADTAEINDSSAINFFRGEREDRTILDLYNIVYEF